VHFCQSQEEKQNNLLSSSIKEINSVNLGRCIFSPSWFSFNASDITALAKTYHDKPSQSGYRKLIND
jgi:hypothetical protein